jgi:hypothetical protein
MPSGLCLVALQNCATIDVCLIISRKLLSFVPDDVWGKGMIWVPGATMTQESFLAQDNFKL